MIYLILSILASSAIFVIFKLFDRFKINRLQAIIFNYGVACICGVLSYNASATVTTIIEHSWFWYAVAMGLVFISIFNAMAITAQKNGLSVVAVSSKMSVVIPIIAGFVLYDENINVLKLAGIIIALVSIYMVTINPEKVNQKASLLFPLIVFVGSGFIDSSIKYLETTYVAPNEVSLFSATIFGAAFSIGLCVFIYQMIKGKFKFEIKNVIGGIILGVINYYSVYFLIKAIGYKNVESSIVFTVNNVAILLVSALLGTFFFKERLTTQNKIGIALAIVGIVLVSSSGSF